MVENVTQIGGAKSPDYTGLTAEDYENAIDALFYMSGDEGMYHLIKNRALQCMKRRLNRTSPRPYAPVQKPPDKP